MARTPCARRPLPRCDLGAQVRRDDEDVGAGRLQGRELRCRDRAATHNHDPAAVQLQKRGKERDDGSPRSRTNEPKALKGPEKKKARKFLTSGLRLRLVALDAVSGHQRVDRRQGSPKCCIQQQQLHAQGLPENIYPVISFSRPSSQAGHTGTPALGRDCQVKLPPDLVVVVGQLDGPVRLRRRNAREGVRRGSPP